ncbi:MAG: serine hydrolase [Phycisphaerales bacterium]
MIHQYTRTFCPASLAALLVAILGCMVWPSGALAQDEDGEMDFAHAPAVATPDTPVGRQLEWVMGLLNGSHALPIANAEEHFHEVFLKQVPPAKLSKALADIRESAFGGSKIDLIQVLQDGEGDFALTGLVRGGKESTRVLSVFIAIHEDDKRIVGLRFDRAGYDFGNVGDWDAYRGTMGKRPGLLSFGAYELIEEVPGWPRNTGARNENEPKDAETDAEKSAKPLPTFRLKPIHQIYDDKRLAVGSAFKLWVLGAIAEDVIAGKRTWDETMAIDDAFKSLPSGTMQNEAAGSEHPLEHFAMKMISISDNTATDHLIHRVGRGRCAAYFSRFSDDPTRTLPFLSTMEMFKLKLAPLPESPDDDPEAFLAPRYIGASEAEQAAMLAGPMDNSETTGAVTSADPIKSQIMGWTTPRFVDSLEWFASARELAKTLADLHRLELDDRNEPMRRVLRKNPGLMLDKGTWKEIAYKGGSEPGVLSMNFLLTRKDDRLFVVTATWNSLEQPLDEERLFALVKRGIELAGETE